MAPVENRSAEVDPETLGQLMTAGGILHMLPLETQLVDFSRGALKKIPGISDCTFCLQGTVYPAARAPGSLCDGCPVVFQENDSAPHAPCPRAARGNLLVIPIEASPRLFGFALIEVSDPNRLASYQPFLYNFINLIAVNLEVHRQQEQLQQANQDLKRNRDHLEELVNIRTAELRQSEECYKTVADYTYDWEYWQKADGTLVYISPSCERITGYAVCDFLEHPGLLPGIVHPDDRDRLEKHLREEVRPQEGCAVHLLEFRIVTRSGETRWIGHVCQPVYDHHRVYLGCRGSNRDITERKNAESEKENLQQQLLQVQKMQSVGILAGGVAHEFNNLLQGIGGHNQLLLLDKKEGDPEFDNLTCIRRLVDRAAQLVRQLLLFSRRVEPQKTILDLNQVVEETGRLLERTLPRTIAIERNLQADLWPLEADFTQMQQVLVNLATNAADALPEGGRVTIETKNVSLSGEFVQSHPEGQAGDHVRLTFSDSGKGMASEVLDHLFEPFFTTKEVGHGTGLGLASVYGIVKTHGGTIDCRSQIGRGTTFEIYLPARKTTPGKNIAGAPITEPLPSGRGTILLVDDEEPIRGFARIALKKSGYTVLTAASGEEALEIYKAEAHEIDLVILDLGMPGMGGHRCLLQVIRTNPAARVILASGYALDDQVRKSLAAGAAGYVAKPYSLADLLEKVREVLADGRTPGSPIGN